MFFNQNFLLGSSGVAAAVSITDQNFTDTQSPGPAECQYSLFATGIAYRTTLGGGAVAISGEWLVGGSASAFETRATINSGTLTSGTTGSWLGLGTNRVWVKEKVGAGSATVNLTIEIRRASDGVVLDSATIIMTGDVS